MIFNIIINNYIINFYINKNKFNFNYNKINVYIKY